MVSQDSDIANEKVNQAKLYLKRRPPIELEKISATHIINKELVSRPHKSVRKKYRRKKAKNMN